MFWPSQSRFKVHFIDKQKLEDYINSSETYQCVNTSTASLKSQWKLRETYQCVNTSRASLKAQWKLRDILIQIWTY